MSTTHQLPRPASYGHVFRGLEVDGKPLRHGVFDEHQVRIAAGLTLTLGASAFAAAFFGQIYWPIQLVTLLFTVEFAMRVVHGITASPVGLLAGWLTRGRAPQWVSARPKRFAWSLGLVMAASMAVITNLGIRGALPLSVCAVCLALMWLEAVLGLCLGCEIHAFMVGRGWVARDDTIEICSQGACRPGGRR